MKLVFFLIVAAASAAPQSNSGAKAGKPDKDKTEHSFDDVLVQGKYHFSDEAIATVEEDKVLDALIGVRTDFKDRLELSSDQY